MPTLSIHTLAEEFFAAAGIAPVEPRADGHGVLAFSVHLREVEVTVSQDPIDHPDELTVHVVFGQVPLWAEAAVLRELLQMNLRMQGPGAPAFGFNARTRDAVLRYPYPLARASGEQLWAGLQVVVDSALQWRLHHFLDAAQAPAAPPCLVSGEGQAPFA